MRIEVLKMEMRRKLTRLIRILAMTLMLTMVIPSTVQAAEEVTIIDVVQAKGAVEAKVEPDEKAETAMTFEDGAMIAVVSDSDAQWYTIGYQGNIYYVKKSDTIVLEDSPFRQQNTDIDAEFEENYIESKILVEEVVRLQEEAKSTRLWGIVILVLVAAIFGINTYLIIKGRKDKEDKNGGMEN